MSKPQPLLNVAFSSAQRRAIAEFLPGRADRLKLDEKNPRSIGFAVAELQSLQQKGKEALLKSKNGAKQNTLRLIVDSVTNALQKADNLGLIPGSDQIFQFKITLLESKPPIWRRIQTKDCTLDKLHEHIQTAMGWTNSHLHQFKIGRQLYGDLELLDDGFIGFECEDSRQTQISEIVHASAKQFSFVYEYDFGDGWHHEVEFEGILSAEKGQRFPVCVEGERACPPEDVGGAWGYEEFLNVLNDPTHEDYEQFSTWSAPFDPEAFDAKRATRAMRRGLPDWRKYD